MICHGLKNAANLNRKIGDLRDYNDDTKRYEVYFEDKTLKPVAVKHGNLRIVQHLLSLLQLRLVQSWHPPQRLQMPQLRLGPRRPQQLFLPSFTWKKGKPVLALCVQEETGQEEQKEMTPVTRA